MFFKKKNKDNSDVQVISNDYIEANQTVEAQNESADKVQVQSNIKVHSKTNNEIMNSALELFLDFGDCNKELMYARMADICTCMSGEGAKTYENFSSEVRDNIFKIMEKLYLKEIGEEDVMRLIRDSYPFINNQNYKRLYSLGLCSAWEKHSK